MQIEPFGIDVGNRADRCQAALSCVQVRFLGQLQYGLLYRRPVHLDDPGQFHELVVHRIGTRSR